MSKFTFPAAKLSLAGLGWLTIIKLRLGSCNNEMLACLAAEPTMSIIEKKEILLYGSRFIHKYLITFLESFSTKLREPYLGSGFSGGFIIFNPLFWISGKLTALFVERVASFWLQCVSKGIIYHIHI